jgi:YadA-like membrane anchor domain
VDVEKLASRGTAIALAATPDMSHVRPGKTGVGVAVGRFNGETALGATLVHVFKDEEDDSRKNVAVSGAVSGKNVGLRASFGFEF